MISRILGGSTLLLGIALALCASMLIGARNKIERLELENAGLQAQVKSLEDDIAAIQSNSLERSADDSKLTGQGRELEDARTNPRDSDSDRRMRSICVKLRQQSPDRFNATPACSRFGSKGGATDSTPGA